MCSHQGFTYIPWTTGKVQDACIINMPNISFNQNELLNVDPNNIVVYDIVINSVKSTSICFKTSYESSINNAY